MSKVDLKYLKDGSVGAAAQENIEAGLVLENCPILKLSWTSKYHGDPSVANYAFRIPCDTDECKKHGNPLFIPLGWGLLYKHSDNPNCNIHLSRDGSTMVIQANKAIKTNSLLTINKNSLAPITNTTPPKIQSEFSEEDLNDDEEFMKKMAMLLEKQNQS